MPSYSGVWNLNSQLQAVGVQNWPSFPANWITVSGGVNNDFCYGAVVDGLGNLYVTGETSSSGAGNNDVFLIKYTKFGSIQWQRLLGGSSDETGFGLALDSSNNIYVAGNTSSQGGGVNAFIVKYDSLGNLIWQQGFGNAGTETFNGVSVDGSGNAYVAGVTNTQGSGNGDLLVVKYNSSGAIQWQRILGSASYDQASGVTVDTSGNVYACGYTFGQGTGTYNSLIVKYDTNGTIQWQRVLGSVSQGLAKSVAIDSSSNVYVLCNDFDSAQGRNDLVLAKYNTSGTIQWQRRIGGVDGNEQAQGISIDTASNIYLCGQTNNPVTAGVIDAFIAKYDTNGTIQWQRVLGGAITEVASGISIDNIGNFYISGYTNISGTGSFDILVAKLPTSGALTGTYGPWTYAASSLPTSTASLTAATSTLTSATSTLDGFTTNLTGSTPSFVSTVTPV